MLLPQYFALCKYLNQNPPVHTLAAVYMGVKTGGEQTPNDGSEHRALAGIAASMNKKPG